MLKQKKDPGYTRDYFYRRFASAAREVVERGMSTAPEVASERVIRVDLQEALSRLKLCPVCGIELTFYPDYPLERSCDCGDFTITAVWSTGDVSFEFKMHNPSEAQEPESDALS